MVISDHFNGGLLMQGSTLGLATTGAAHVFCSDRKYIDNMTLWEGGVTWDGVHLFENWREKNSVCLHRHLLAHLGELTTDRWMVRQRDRCAKSVMEGHTNQQTDKN